MFIATSLEIDSMTLTFFITSNNIRQNHNISMTQMQTVIRIENWSSDIKRFWHILSIFFTDKTNYSNNIQFYTKSNYEQKNLRQYHLPKTILNLILYL